MPAKIKNTKVNFDSEFRFLLTLDPAFEEWRALAKEWWSEVRKTDQQKAAISAFFVSYLHGKNISKSPVDIFKRSMRLPDLFTALDLKENDLPSNVRHDFVVDFLEWVLETHLSVLDADGHQIVPQHLKNPFKRIRKKVIGKGGDISFSHVVARDSRMKDWQELAAEWLSIQKFSTETKLQALNKLLISYILNCDLPRNPIVFLNRKTLLPDISRAILSEKKSGAVGVLSAGDLKHINNISDFLGWVLQEKLSFEDEHGRMVVPIQLHNPISRLSLSGVPTPTESVYAPLSMRYIKELRKMLAQGPHFRDWTWAQSAITTDAGGGGDWFVVDPQIVNRDDPDCVWRMRETTYYERTKLGRSEQVTELWSPVRAMVLYLKLELPLRTHQVVMLDSGEADTWHYVHSPEGGQFVLNDSPLSIGSKSRPYQRGVFHRSQRESGAGLYINTNKTADINKSEKDKGYVIPWLSDVPLYWLEKLRDWQSRYNPISEPTPWSSLTHKHFQATPPNATVLAARGAACFLFRDAAAKGDDRFKPITKTSINNIWHRLLILLEQRCVQRGEKLADGTPIQFVDPDSDTGTHFPLHSLRVSLISYFVLDLQLPLAVVSKLIAGHARIIMTLYYTKFGRAYMREVLKESECRILQADQDSHARFLMEATLRQVGERFASLSADAGSAAIAQKSRAAFIFEDKGICPVGGGMCDVGGESLTEKKSAPQRNIYAPVPGYPHERNCVQCRFFLTGPAFVPGLMAHFNSLSYELHERCERYNTLLEELSMMENHRSDCEREGQIFSGAGQFERLSQRNEAEAEAAGRLLNGMQATFYLISRSLEILKQNDRDGVQLVAVGEMSDINVALTETSSELYQIEVLCENATVYPEIDAKKPVLRRSQLLDAMLELNDLPPILFKLDPNQQLAAGNALMELLQARTGSLKGAVEFAEGKRRLGELGIVDEAWNAISDVAVGTAAHSIISKARKRLSLSTSVGGVHAS